MFLVPRLTPASPGNPGGSSPAKPGDDASPAESGSTCKTGPFQVRALGNRLGTPRYGPRPRILQENVIGISVKPREKKKAMALWDILQTTNFRQVGIEKLGPPSKTKQSP